MTSFRGQPSWAKMMGRKGRGKLTAPNDTYPKVNEAEELTYFSINIA
jgi:hypothetical protein